MRSKAEVGFRITGAKGFQMTFVNGWTVSVQWGPGNYCANKNYDYLDWAKDGKKSMASPDAEIAAWDKDGKWFRFENDDVQGYVGPDEALAFILKIMRKAALDAKASP